MMFETNERDNKPPMLFDYERYVEIEFKKFPNRADVETLVGRIAIELQKGNPVVLLPHTGEKK
jgi:hypothetical protein